VIVFPLDQGSFVDFPVVCSPFYWITQETDKVASSRLLFLSVSKSAFFYFSFEPEESMFQFYRRKEIGLSAATHVASNVSLNAMYQHRVHNVSETDRLCWHVALEWKRNKKDNNKVLSFARQVLTYTWCPWVIDSLPKQKLHGITGWRWSFKCSADGNFWKSFLDLLVLNQNQNKIEGRIVSWRNIPSKKISL